MIQDKDEELLAAADRIKWALTRKRLKGTAPELVQKTGIKPSSARSYLNGTRNPSLEASLKMGEALEVNGFWLFSGEGDKLSVDRPLITENASKLFTHLPHSSNKSLTVYSAALAGVDGEIELMIERSHRVPAPVELEHVPDAYGAKVVGDSMQERFYGGDTVFVNPYEPVVRHNDVIVQLYADDGGSSVYGLIKRFIQLDEKELVLLQLNPKKELRYPRKRVKSVHKIVTATYR